MREHRGTPSLSVYVLVAGFCICACLAGLGNAGEWPGWRGPSFDGKSSEKGIFGPGPFELVVQWSRPLGIAYSGISIADGRAVTMFADGEFDYVTAVDATSGKEIWRYKIDTMFPSQGGSDGGPVSIPVIDNGTVYGLGAKGHLFALDLSDGRQVWSVRIDEKLGARAPHFGFTTTPLVIGDLLFVETGGDEGRSLSAFERKSGKVRWSTGDDVVGYQSPILATLAGTRQIVAVSNKLVLGLEPESGKVLWSHEHGTVESRDGSGTPVLLGDDRFLITGRTESAAFQLRRDATGLTVANLWTSTSLKQTFATPILHEGYLYGFDGDFLTCVEASTGEKVWKSRPPGGRGMILVDGHLIILAAKGDVVAVEATPEGYREKARVNVSELGSFTYPSFADGMIFVRNVRDFAGLRVQKGSSKGTAGVVAPSHEFGKFVRELEHVADKNSAVDGFMSTQKSFPLVEDDRWAHFVYRGDADDVAITGNMTEMRVEEPLQRVAGTDLFHASYPIEPGARWEYRFNVDFDNMQVDPLNPRRVPGEDGEMSELVTSTFVEADYIRAYSGNRPGRVESLDLESERLENTRKVHVYLPAGYDSGESRYPVVYLSDGLSWLEKANLPNSLDHLIGRDVKPIIAVFVEQPAGTSRGEMGGARSAEYVEMLTDELIPRIDSTYRTTAKPGARAILGAGRGALMAAFAALDRPDLFGSVGGCSLYLADPLGGELISRLDTAPSSTKPRFYLSWNRYEMRRAEWDLDLGQDSLRLVEALRKQGFDVGGGEVMDGAGWGSWRVRAGEILRQIFPM